MFSKSNDDADKQLVGMVKEFFDLDVATTMQQQKIEIKSLEQEMLKLEESNKAVLQTTTKSFDGLSGDEIVSKLVESGDQTKTADVLSKLVNTAQFKAFIESDKAQAFRDTFIQPEIQKQRDWLIEQHQKLLQTMQEEFESKQLNATGPLEQTVRDLKQQLEENEARLASLNMEKQELDSQYRLQSSQMADLQQAANQTFEANLAAALTDQTKAAEINRAYLNRTRYATPQDAPPSKTGDDVERKADIDADAIGRAGNAAEKQQDKEVKNEEIAEGDATSKSSKKKKKPVLQETTGTLQNSEAPADITSKPTSLSDESLNKSKLPTVANNDTESLPVPESGSITTESSRTGRPTESSDEAAAGQQDRLQTDASRPEAGVEASTAAPGVVDEEQDTRTYEESARDVCERFEVFIKMMLSELSMLELKYEDQVEAEDTTTNQKLDRLRQELMTMVQSQLMPNLETDLSEANKGQPTFDSFIQPPESGLKLDAVGKEEGSGNNLQRDDGLPTIIIEKVASEEAVSPPLPELAQLDRDIKSGQLHESQLLQEKEAHQASVDKLRLYLEKVLDHIANLDQDVRDADHDLTEVARQVASTERFKDTQKQILKVLKAATAGVQEIAGQAGLDAEKITEDIVKTVHVIEATNYGGGGGVKTASIDEDRLRTQPKESVSDDQGSPINSREQKVEQMGNSGDVNNQMDNEGRPLILPVERVASEEAVSPPLPELAQLDRDIKSGQLHESQLLQEKEAHQASVDKLRLYLEKVLDHIANLDQDVRDADHDLTEVARQVASTERFKDTQKQILKVLKAATAGVQEIAGQAGLDAEKITEDIVKTVHVIEATNYGGGGVKIPSQDSQSKQGLVEDFGSPTDTQLESPHEDYQKRFSPKVTQESVQASKRSAKTKSSEDAAKTAEAKTDVDQLETAQPTTASSTQIKSTNDDPQISDQIDAGAAQHLRSSIASQEEQNRRDADEVSSARQSYDDLIGRRDTLAREAERLREELQTLQQQSAEAENQVANLQEQQSQIQSERDRMLSANRGFGSEANTAFAKGTEQPNPMYGDRMAQSNNEAKDSVEAISPNTKQAMYRRQKTVEGLGMGICVNPADKASEDPLASLDSTTLTRDKLMEDITALLDKVKAQSDAERDATQANEELVKLRLTHEKLGDNLAIHMRELTEVNAGIQAIKTESKLLESGVAGVEAVKKALEEAMNLIENIDSDTVRSALHKLRKLPGDNPEAQETIGVNSPETVNNEQKDTGKPALHHSATLEVPEEKDPAIPAKPTAQQGTNHFILPEITEARLSDEQSDQLERFLEKLVTKLDPQVVQKYMPNTKETMPQSNTQSPKKSKGQVDQKKSQVSDGQKTNKDSKTSGKIASPDAKATEEQATDDNPSAVLSKARQDLRDSVMKGYSPEDTRTPSTFESLSLEEEDLKSITSSIEKKMDVATKKQADLAKKASTDSSTLREGLKKPDTLESKQERIKLVSDIIYTEGTLAGAALMDIAIRSRLHLILEQLLNLIDHLAVGSLAKKLTETQYLTAKAQELLKKALLAVEASDSKSDTSGYSKESISSLIQSIDSVLTKISSVDRSKPEDKPKGLTTKDGSPVGLTDEKKDMQPKKNFFADTTNNSQQPAPGPSTPGIFGSMTNSNQQPAPSPVTPGLFGSTPTSSQQPTPGLFGSTPTTSQQPTTGFFGSTPTSSQQSGNNPFLSASNQTLFTNTQPAVNVPRTIDAASTNDQVSTSISPLLSDCTRLYIDSTTRWLTSLTQILSSIIPEDLHRLEPLFQESVDIIKLYFNQDEADLPTIYDREAALQKKIAVFVESYDWDDIADGFADNGEVTPSKESSR